MSNAILILEDGTYVEGKYAGVKKDVFGEIVFNTSMTGYEETFTDPSYAGQILLMTYPLIGNYGVRKTNFESKKVQIRGLVLKEPYFFSYRAVRLEKFLKQTKIPCIYGIDTRALTLKIRKYGTMKAMLMVKSPKKITPEKVIKNIIQKPHPDTDNLVSRVSCKKIIAHKNKHSKRIVLIDCGVKLSILKNLKKYASVIQVPYDTNARAIEKFKPHGIVLSNGPGNPEHAKLIATTITTVKRLIGKYPLLGICLGHQLLGIALGFKTYKMKFGHRGSNHAVKNLFSNKIFITSQNHGYALKGRHNKNVEVEWINVNDGTIEGFRHKKLLIWSVQFHPEAAPGPYDTSFLFKKFVESI
jgi:carbamoyl-phosphate synthase small subunit